MNKAPRNEYIDILRGISVAAVISLHTLANYLSIQGIVNFWDLQQFAVQMFVFCSAYLFFSKPGTLNRHTFFDYFKKRFLRLYIPYFIFLSVFFVLVFFLSPKTFDLSQIIQAIFVLGGIDINWLVLLFIQLAFLFPLIRYLYYEKRFFFYGYIFLTVYTAGFLFFVQFPFHWKWIMWLPWSFMALYALFYLRHENDEETINLSYLYFACLFIMLECIQYSWKGTISIYPNKYPPNMLILAYGIIWMGLVQQLYKAGIFHILQLDRLISFLSRYSYSLFFIHFLIIYIMNVFHLNIYFSWYVYFIVLFTSTLIIQKVIHYFLSMLKNVKPN